MEFEVSKRLIFRPTLSYDMGFAVREVKEVFFSCKSQGIGGEM